MREREGRKDIITVHHAIRVPRLERQQTVKRDPNDPIFDLALENLNNRIIFHEFGITWNIITDILILKSF